MRDGSGVVASRRLCQPWSLARDDYPAMITLDLDQT